MRSGPIEYLAKMWCLQANIYAHFCMDYPRLLPCTTKRSYLQILHRLKKKRIHRTLRTRRKWRKKTGKSLLRAMIDDFMREYRRSQKELLNDIANQVIPLVTMMAEMEATKRSLSKVHKSVLLP